MWSIKLLPGAAVGWSLVPDKREGKETFGWCRQFLVVCWKYGYLRCFGMICVTVFAPPISAGGNMVLFANPLSEKWHSLSQLVTFPGSCRVIPTTPWCLRSFQSVNGPC